MSRQIHIVNQEHAPRTQCRDSFAELEDLSSGSIWEYQVERAKRPDYFSAVTLDDRDPFGPIDRPRLFDEIAVELDARHIYIAAIADAVNDPSQSHTCSGTELQHSPVDRNCMRKERYEPPDVRL